MSVSGYTQKINASSQVSTIIDRVEGLSVEGKSEAAPNEIVEFQFQVQAGGDSLRYDVIIFSNKESLLENKFMIHNFLL